MEALPVPAKQCQFNTGDPFKPCPHNVRARGYCDTHYRALRKAGAFAPIKYTPRDVIKSNAKSIQRARRKLDRAMPLVAEALIDGAIRSAKRGDTRAAQWLAVKTDTVRGEDTPIANDARPTTTINIGVKVSGVNDQG